MSASSSGVAKRSLQSLLLKRFGMAVATYALVVVLIADMDNITGGHRLRVNQQPLVDVQQMMQQPIP